MPTYEEIFIQLFINYAMMIISEFTQTLKNPSLILPFFAGFQLIAHPHVSSKSIFGFQSINRQTADLLKSAARKSGLATAWLYTHPVFYITNNEIRKAIQQEGRIGVIHVNAAKKLSWYTNNNLIMTNFLAFMSIDSTRYKSQRKFLKTFSHSTINYNLPQIKATIGEYLSKCCAEYSDKSINLREFLIRMELHTSSELLDLTNKTLAELYLENAEFKNAINQVAHNGISEEANTSLQDSLYKLFCVILQNNQHILNDLNNLITNIITTTLADNNDFTNILTYRDFSTLNKNIQMQIAMNFASVGLGAMVHSTINSLDWIIGLLLNNPEKLNELKQLAAEHPYADLSNSKTFDKEDGELFALSEWVLRTIYHYPTFSHEFFFNNQAFDVVLPNSAKLTIPESALIVVNYTECNRTNKVADYFPDLLTNKNTIANFVYTAENASFGGSASDDDKNYSFHTRRCPGAQLAIYKLIIALYSLLTDCDLKPTSNISPQSDPQQFPLLARENIGDILVTKVHQANLKKAEASSAVESKMGEPQRTQSTIGFYNLFNRVNTTTLALGAVGASAAALYAYS